MSQLLAELRDGHVNLISTFDYGRYWQWRSEGPRSYDETLIESYLGDDYHIAGGLAYKALDYPKACAVLSLSATSVWHRSPRRSQVAM